MEEEKYQKELFEFEEPKKSFSRLSDMLPKAGFEGNVSITLTLEKMVFIFIGIIMLMVIVYALGVESGKLRTTPGVQSSRRTAPVSNEVVLQTRVNVLSAKNILNTAPVAPTNKPAEPVKTVIPMPAIKPYTILAGSYVKREGAQASAAIMTRQGFNVTITYSKPYYRVCVGSYVNKAGIEAQKDLIKVKRIYKDAIIKLK